MWQTLGEIMAIIDPDNIGDCPDEIDLTEDIDPGPMELVDEINQLRGEISAAEKMLTETPSDDANHLRLSLEIEKLQKQVKAKEGELIDLYNDDETPF